MSHLSMCCLFVSSHSPLPLPQWINCPPVRNWGCFHQGLTTESSQQLMVNAFTLSSLNLKTVQLLLPCCLVFLVWEFESSSAMRIEYDFQYYLKYKLFSISMSINHQWSHQFVVCWSFDYVGWKQTYFMEKWMCVNGMLNNLALNNLL